MGTHAGTFYLFSYLFISNTGLHPTTEQEGTKHFEIARFIQIKLVTNQRDIDDLTTARFNENMFVD